MDNKIKTHLLWYQKRIIFDDRNRADSGVGTYKMLYKVIKKRTHDKWY